MENIVMLTVNRIFAQGLRCRQSEIKTFAAAERSGVSLSAGTARPAVDILGVVVMRDLLKGREN